MYFYSRDPRGRGVEFSIESDASLWAGPDSFLAVNQSVCCAHCLVNVQETEGGHGARLTERAGVTTSYTKWGFHS